MALARPLFVGFSSACKQARDGGNLEVTVDAETGPRTFLLPWFVVRQVDVLLESWRRQAHEASLLTMNNGVLGYTLAKAAAAGGLRDSAFLLAHGADVNHGNEHVNPLRNAAYGGHLAVVRLLLDAGAGRLGRALQSAASSGHAAVGALLLDRGADISFDARVLHYVSHFGHLEFVRLLLDRGAEVNADGGTPLRWAREGGHEAVVALLLERGAVEL